MTRFLLALGICLVLGTAQITARPPAMFLPPPFFEPITDSPAPVEPILADEFARFPWAPRPVGMSLEEVIEMLPHARPDVPLDDQKHTLEYHCSRLCLDDDIDFACNGTTLPCSPCISDCLAQTPNQDFRLQSMVQQEFLVSTRFAWNPPAEAAMRGCYLTWETQGGGYVGHMMADRGKAELGLWPRTRYTVRLQCKAARFAPFFPQNRIYVDTSKAVSMKPDPEEPSNAEKAHRLALAARKAAAARDGPLVEAAKPSSMLLFDQFDLWMWLWVGTVAMGLAMTHKIIRMRQNRKASQMTKFTPTPEMIAARKSGTSYCFVLCCGKMLKVWPLSKLPTADGTEKETDAEAVKPIAAAVVPEVATR